MQQADPVANANLSLAAALKKFEALTLADQLPILALVLRYEGGRLGAVQRPARTSKVPRTSKVRAAAPVDDQPLAPSEDAEAVVGEPRPQPEPQQRGENDLRALAAAAIDDRPLPQSEDAEAVVSEPRPQPEPQQRGENDFREPAAAIAAAKMQLVEYSFLGQQGENQSSSRAAVRMSRSVGAENPPAVRFQNLSIAMTMILSFSLTLGTMLWQRKATPATREPEMTATAPAQAPAPVSAGPATQPIRAADPEPTVPTGASPSRGGTAGEMPVKLYFHRRIVHNDPNERGRISWLSDGRIFNLSGESMTVDVRVVNASTQNTSQVQVAVGPNSEKDFGMDDGLEMHPDDQITLQSAPYPNLVTRVR